VFSIPISARPGAGQRRANRGHAAKNDTYVIRRRPGKGSNGHTREGAEKRPAGGDDSSTTLPPGERERRGSERAGPDGRNQGLGLNGAAGAGPRPAVWQPRGRLLMDKQRGPKTPRGAVTRPIPAGQTGRTKGAGGGTQVEWAGGTGLGVPGRFLSPNGGPCPGPDQNGPAGPPDALESARRAILCVGPSAF